jgi:hypothetical protein
LHAALTHLLALALVFPTVAAADVTDRLVRTLQIAPGTPIRVEATVADVTIVGSDRSDLSVEIVRRAPSAGELAKYPVAIDENPAALRIAVVQQEEGRDPNLKTDITIAAPLNAVFQAIRVFEGRLKLTNLRGACDADLRRGALEATGVGGRVLLEGGIGSLDVRQPELTPGGMMRLRLFNGALKVRLSHLPSSARILAVTLNGTITSDIPLTMKDKFGPRFGETTIGNGDPVMSIDVVKGNIAIVVESKRP